MLKNILAILFVAVIVLPMDLIKAYEIRENNSKYELACQQALEKDVQEIFLPLDEYFQNTSLEFKLGGFVPFAQRSRRIYADVWWDLGFEATKTFCTRYQAWIGLDYIFTNGESTELDKKTRLNFIPLSLGISYLYPINSCLTAYLGVGGVYSFLWIRDHSKYFRNRVNNNGFGGIIKTGCYYYLCENIYIDAFLNYFYQYFTFRNHKAKDSGFVQRNNINLSGLKFGLGVEVRF